MRRSAPARISSSTPEPTYPQQKARSATFCLVWESAGVDRLHFMREIVFDTETTGLNPAGGDRMVEIGCVEMFNRVETGRHFHAYFNPEREMPSDAEAVHGLTTIFLSDKPRFPERAEELLEFIADSPLVAHNASFDFGFLNSEFTSCGRPAVCPSRIGDTLTLARARHAGAKH